MLLEQAVCAAGNAGDSGAGTAVERATRTEQAGLVKAVVGSGARSTPEDGPDDRLRAVSDGAGVTVV
jgi:hypothetical protein